LRADQSLDRKAVAATLMAHVVLLRGVNVGGHRTFRPRLLAEQLRHLDAVNFGAAGTFVIRKPVTRARLRREFARRLSFDARIMICSGRDIIRLASRDFFVGHADRPDIVRFASVLSRAPRSVPPLPITIPETGLWFVRILALEGRFVVGVHRREMKAIGYLGKLDDVFGVAATTRSWSTILSVADVLRK
jgi:uncharacterized protein (DUF1697 family)